MKRICIIVSILLFCFGTSLFAQEHTGRIIVQFKNDVDISSNRAANKRAFTADDMKRDFSFMRKPKFMRRLVSNDVIQGIRNRGAGSLRSAKRDAFERIGNRLESLYILDINETDSFSAVLTELKHDSRVEFAEPDYIIPTELEPSDPSYSRQTQYMQQAMVPFGWDIISNASPVKVAIVDTGIDYNHPDLKGLRITGIDARTMSSRLNPETHPHNYNEIPYDDASDSHGTFMAGIIGATANNGIGVSGLAWNVELFIVKTHDSNGDGRLSDCMYGIFHAIYVGAEIINCSWGIYDTSASLHRAIDDTQDAGILVVTSAGNSSKNNDHVDHYPSDYTNDNVIAVSSLNSDGTGLRSASNYGVSSVDLAAPGSSLYSTIRTAQGSYGYASGTSEAAAFITGVAALLKSLRPDWGYREIRQCIFDTVDKKSALYGKVSTGGTVNVYKALQYAYEPLVQDKMPGIITSRFLSRYQD